MADKPWDTGENRRDALIARVAAPPDHRALENVDPLDLTLGDPPKTLHSTPGFGPHGVGAKEFRRDHHANEQGKPDRRSPSKGEL